MFLIFGLKLGDHEWRKVTEPVPDFTGKIWFAQKRGERVQNAPKMDPFNIQSKIAPNFFLQMLLNDKASC